jgi:hypothetical protein
VSGRRDKEGQELAAELQALGAEALFVRTDVRNDDDMRDWWKGPSRASAVWMPLSIALELRAHPAR